MFYRSCLFVLFLFLAMAGRCQPKWMVPAVKPAQGVKACAIYKTIAYSNGKGDSTRQLFATLQFNAAGQMTLLLAFSEDSVPNFEEIHDYNAQGLETLVSQRDRPDTTFYNFVPQDELSKHMKEEFYDHNLHIQTVSGYDANNRLVRQTSYAASFNVRLTEKNISLNERYIYDAAGRLVRELILDDDDSTVVQATKSYAYDAAGNMVKKTETQAKDTSVSEYIYNAANKLTEIRFGVKPGKPYYTERYTYNAQNNCLSIIKRDDKDSAYSFNDYEYKDTVVIAKRFHNDRGDFNSETLYTYDAEHRLVREQKNVLDGSPYYNDVTHYRVKIRRYDADSNIISEKRYYRKKNKKNYAGRSEYAYNKAKQVIKEKEYYDDGELREIRFYEYNALNQRVKILRFDKDSIQKETEINFYDARGLRKARELYDPSGKLILYQTYVHNSEGEEVGGIFFQRGMQTTVRDYVYDDKGLLQEIKVKNPEGQHFRYIYRYTYR